MPSGHSADLFSISLLILVAMTAFNLLVPLLIPTPPSLPTNSHIGTATVTGREWDIQLSEVALTVEDTVNFQLDTSQGAAQWQAIQPSSKGFVALADNSTHRLSMFHALECLDTIRRGVLARKADRQTTTTADVHLCLDYLRQTIQCRADVQLEQVRSEYGGKSVQPFVTHRNCRDWSRVYAELEEQRR